MASPSDPPRLTVEPPPPEWAAVCPSCGGPTYVWDGAGDPLVCDPCFNRRRDDHAADAAWEVARMRKDVADHLADVHGVWLTRREFADATLDVLLTLDPCRTDGEPPDG